MKFEWKFWTGWTCAAVVIAYCVLAYIFMWSPLVVYRTDTDSTPCRNNLRQIDAAIYEFAVKHKKHTGDPVSFEDIMPYIKLDSRGKIPGCPYGGKYTIGPIGTPPTCSFGTNPSVKVHGDGLTWHYTSESGVRHREN